MAVLRLLAAVRACLYAAPCHDRSCHVERAVYLHTLTRAPFRIRRLGRCYRKRAHARRVCSPPTHAWLTLRRTPRSRPRVCRARSTLAPEAAAAPSSAPLLPPFPEVESISSTTGDSPLTSPKGDLDDDSGSSSWTRKPPRLDGCEDDEDATATKNDWNDYVFKKQAERMKPLIPNHDLEDTVPFVNTFVPVTPPHAAPAEPVNVEAELEEMDLEQPPPATTTEHPGPEPPPGAASFDPDPNRRQENGNLSPAPDTPDDDHLLLLDSRMLKNNILKAMDVRQDRMEALFNRVANHMITNQEFTTNSIIGIETKITSLSATTTKLSTDMKKNAKDQNAIADRIDAELNNHKNPLEKRIAALETAPRSTPQRSSSGSDPVAPATADPWSGYNLEGLGKQALAPTTTPTRSSGPDRDFQPSCVILMVPPQWEPPLPLHQRCHRPRRKGSP